MDLDADGIKRILQALEASSWDEAVVTVGDVTIAVGRNGLSPGSAPRQQPDPPPRQQPDRPPRQQPGRQPEPPAAAPRPPPLAPAEPPAAEGLVVRAPSVGIFWRSPQPGRPPYVEVGSRVAPGDVVGVLEVMKLMSNVLAEVAGVVSAIHVANAAQVEYGTPLMTITSA